MRNEVVRLRQRLGSERAERWHGRALSNRSLGGRAASVVLLFPERMLFAERMRVASVKPDVLKLVASLELENAQLRRQVVELALQIQDLKERRR
jgi:hypothetical protein